MKTSFSFVNVSGLFIVQRKKIEFKQPSQIPKVTARGQTGRKLMEMQKWQCAMIKVYELPSSLN